MVMDMKSQTAAAADKLRAFGLGRGGSAQMWQVTPVPPTVPFLVQIHFVQVNISMTWNCFSGCYHLSCERRKCCSFLSVCIKIKGTTVHYQRARQNYFFPWSRQRGVIQFSTQAPKINSSPGTHLQSFNWGASNTFGFRQSCRPCWIGFHVSTNQPWAYVSINSSKVLLRVLKKPSPLYQTQFLPLIVKLERDHDRVILTAKDVLIQSFGFMQANRSLSAHLTILC